MPITKQNKITSWSFSRYSDYKTCPLKAKLKHLDKISEPPNPAMARGAAIHKLAEDFITGKIARMPVELKLFAVEFKALKTKYKKTGELMVEDTWAFTDNWSTTAWNDWVGCWVRIKLDLAHQTEPGVLEVTDWKTGKFRPESNADYLEQLELYALGAFLMCGDIHMVKPKLKYLDVGEIFPPDDDPLVYTRKDVPKLKKIWAARTKAMMNDKAFLPKPNSGCRFCFYRSSNKAAGGGQCKY